MSANRAAIAFARAGTSSSRGQRARAARALARTAVACAFGAAVCAGGSARGDGAAGDHAPREHRAATVRLAEVASHVEAGASPIEGVTELLRADVESELAAIDWRKAGLRRSYLVSASVVHLSSENAPARVRVSCTVSAAIREAEGGTVLAVLEGRARGEDAPGKGSDLARDALAAAVRGAVTGIPDAIRRSQ